MPNPATERVEIVSITPEPGPGVREAIALALAETWPDPVAKQADEVPAWRFSGRWWAQPAALRRSRPSAIG